MIKKCKHFNIKELVSRQVYEKYGEKAWSFIDDDIKEFLDLIREHFNRPVTVNNWSFGGNLEQRCLRANLDQITKEKTKQNKLYLSAHVLGKGVDFNIKGFNTNQVHQEILKNSEKFKMIKRMESEEATPTWIHVDTISHSNKGIYVFKP